MSDVVDSRGLCGRRLLPEAEDHARKGWAKDQAAAGASEGEKVLAEDDKSNKTTTGALLYEAGKNCGEKEAERSQSYDGLQARCRPRWVRLEIYLGAQPTAAKDWSRLLCLELTRECNMYYT